MLRRLYDWVVAWADSPYGGLALFLLAVAESSFFPIPPDALLIVLAVAAPAKALRYGLLCSAGSVLGGVIGYGIGWQLMASVGQPIVDFYGLAPKMEAIGRLYRQYDAWAVAIAGFTPIPYKVFTLAAGAFRIDFPVFVFSSLVSRSARFFLVAGLIYRFGPGIQPFIQKYFDRLAIAFVVLLAAGFVVIRYLV